MPETVVELEKAVTGTMPPPDPSADLPILVLPVDAPTPDPVQTAVIATDSLPKTASQLPLVGMLGILALLSGLALRAARVLDSGILLHGSVRVSIACRTWSELLRHTSELNLRCAGGKPMLNNTGNE